jgi:hypothetical protein
MPGVRERLARNKHRFLQPSHLLCERALSAPCDVSCPPSMLPHLYANPLVVCLWMETKYAHEECDVIKHQPVSESMHTGDQPVQNLYWVAIAFH